MKEYNVRSPLPKEATMTFPGLDFLAVVTCVVLAFTIVAGLITTYRRKQRERDERI